VAERSESISVPEYVPAGTAEDGDGVVTGAGPATVEIYIDFLCPFCRQFEESSGAALDAIAAAGSSRLVYHPLGFLDRLSGTRYSSRAAAASGCAADRRKFSEYKSTLFANQPEEGGPGLSDEELAQLGHTLGLDPGFGRCIGEGRYLEWSTYVTTRAAERGVSGTPSAFVDGVSLPANLTMIAAAIRSRSRTVAGSA
jgi:protein-disulfide isomerase